LIVIIGASITSNRMKLINKYDKRLFYLVIELLTPLSLVFIHNLVILDD